MIEITKTQTFGYGGVRYVGVEGRKSEIQNALLELKKRKKHLMLGLSMRVRIPQIKQA